MPFYRPNEVDEILEPLFSKVDGSHRELVRKLGGGFIIRIHCKNGLRPSVYTLSHKINQYGFVDSLTLDTIVREEEQHVTTKLTYPMSNHMGMVAQLNLLLTQFGGGSAEETNKNYTPLGLLYQKRA